MSDKDNIAALRAAGHADAAELLEQRAAAAERAEAASSPPGETRPAGIKMVDDAVFAEDDQATREGESMLAAMRAAGIGVPHAAMDIFTGEVKR